VGIMLDCPAGLGQSTAKFDIGLVYLVLSTPIHPCQMNNYIAFGDECSEPI
jgi:hypothetical protein